MTGRSLNWEKVLPEETRKEIQPWGDVHFYITNDGFHTSD